MFRNLYNECRISFNLSTTSPLFIRSGEKLELDPSLPDDQFIRSFYDGEFTAVIPGSSIKGVFRSRAERLLGECCKVFYNDRLAPDYSEYCYNNSRNIPDVKEKYNKICPACKLFGCLSLKSRIEFKDAFPTRDEETGQLNIRFASRHNVGIDRVSGSAKKGALFEPEVLEYGVFRVEIIIRNYFKWQIKTILQVIEDINDGYVSFGGSTSRGFGRMTVNDLDFRLREYGTERLEKGKFYVEKEFSDIPSINPQKEGSRFSIRELKEILDLVPLSIEEYRKVDLKNERI